jgi:hypothetical protein
MTCLAAEKISGSHGNEVEINTSDLHRPILKRNRSVILATGEGDAQFAHIAPSSRNAAIPGSGGVQQVADVKSLGAIKVVEKTLLTLVRLIGKDTALKGHRERIHIERIWGHDCI